MTLVYDPERPPDSVLSRRDPRWRLTSVALAMVGVACLQSLPIIGIALVLTLGLLLLCRLPVRFVLTRLMAFGLFLLPFVIVLPLLQGWDGAHSACRVAGRATTLFSLGLVLLATCPFPHTIQAAQSLGVPIVLTRIVQMSYRYLHVLGEELARIRIAVRVRGFRNRPNLHSYRTIGTVAGTLLVRGAERAERVAHAMQCRGFDGRFRSLTEFRTQAGDVLMFVAIVAPGAALVAWDFLSRS